MHGGLYLEGGYLRRVRPYLRVGATGGREYWWGDDHGFGARTGLTLELVTRFRQRAYSESRSYGVRRSQVGVESGSAGTGLFLDAGYRSLDEDKYAFIVTGVSFRFPAMAGILFIAE